MKKSLFFVILLLVLFIPTIMAHEMYSDGWHPVSKVEDSSRKVWAYYENGKELMRLNALYGTHRGFGDAPENSLIGIEHTRNYGIYAFETDLRFNKDGTGVLCHDDYINHVASKIENGIISTLPGFDSTYSSIPKASRVYLRQLTDADLGINSNNYKYVFNIERLNHSENNITPVVLEGYDNNRITTFEEMLDFVKPNKMLATVELKDDWNYYEENNNLTVLQNNIKNAVDMVMSRNMNNYIRWSSCQSELLLIVKNYYESNYPNYIANIHLFACRTCTTEACLASTNRYYKHNVDYFANKLKSEHTFLFLNDVPDILKELPSTVIGNYPGYGKSVEEGATILVTRHNNSILSVIPQAQINVSNTTYTIDNSEEKTIDYQYDGDGEVKCVSNNPYIECNINSNNSTITIKSLGVVENTTIIKIYATQGLTKSATNDTLIYVQSKTDSSSFIEETSSIIEEVSSSFIGEASSKTTSVVETIDNPKTGYYFYFPFFIIIILISSIFLYVVSKKQLKS